MFSFTVKRTNDEMDRRVVLFKQDGVTTEITLDHPAPEDPQAAFQVCMPKLIEAGLVPKTPYTLER